MPVFGTQMFGSAAAAAGEITGSNTANATAGGSSSAYTFSSQSIGDADDSRIVVVAVTVAWNGSVSTVTGVTVGGASAAQQAAATEGGAENFRAEVWSVAVASGTSADVVVSLSASTGNNRGCGISVYRMIGDVEVGAEDTGTNTRTTGTLSTTVDAKEDGFIVGAAVQFYADACSWTGLTEAADAVTANVTHSSAYVAPSSDSTLTVSAAFTNSYSLAGALAVASWHPT